MVQLNEVHQVKAQHCKNLIARKNVIGVGVGYKIKGEQKTNELVNGSTGPRAGRGPDGRFPGFYFH